jgi:uncharacterized protein YidB (DUF937 family)
MSVLNSVIDGKADLKTEANPIITALSSFLMQSGGVQGLMNKFTHAGLGNVFSSWVGSGPRQPVTGDQIQQILGSERIKGLGAKLGVDPAQTSQLVAEHLPKIIDHLTPAGKIDPSINVRQGLGSVAPSFLQKLTPQPVRSV